MINKLFTIFCVLLCLFSMFSVSVYADNVEDINDILDVVVFDEQSYDTDTYVQGSQDIQDSQDNLDAELLSGAPEFFSFPVFLINLFFQLLDWFLLGFPDFSDFLPNLSFEWLDDFARLIEYSLWFFPLDLLTAYFTIIPLWMSTHLVFAAFNFIMKFVPFIGGGA